MRASFVLLQARDPVEAIRLRAKFLKVWEEVSLLAETPRWSPNCSCRIGQQYPVDSTALLIRS